MHNVFQATMIRRVSSLMLVILFFSIALIFRAQALLFNHPFWVDEFSSARIARVFLHRGLAAYADSTFFYEKYAVLPYTLIALSFKLFGVSEGSARLPFVLIGSLLPILIYLLGQKIFDKWTAVLASMFALFSYFFITWSGQARGYVLLQVVILVSAWLYLSILDKLDREKRLSIKMGSALITTILLGFFTHFLFVFFVISLGVHFSFTHFRLLRSYGYLPWILAVVSFIGLVLWLSGFLTQVWPAFLHLISSHSLNNVRFYHAFLWREYSILTFLGVIGLVVAATRRQPAALLLIGHAALHLFFLCFCMEPTATRYLLPIFPSLMFGAGYTLIFFARLWVGKPRGECIALGVTLLILINGNKYTLLPKRYYSVNHDFREIAVVDYNAVYQVIKTRGQLEKGQTALIDTWADRLDWYIGEQYQPSYFFRWIDGNGVMKQTVYGFNDEGEKVLPSRNNMKFVGELSDLQRVLARYPRGFIWIDDSTLPTDVITYAKQHFKTELSVTRAEIEDNPLSVWPATLYSWGIE